MSGPSGGDARLAAGRSDKRTGPLYLAGRSVGGADSRKHTAALAAYLYSKVTRASDAARLGTPAFMRLEAERGQICVVGAADVVLVTIVTSDANLGRVRLDMMKAARERS